MDCNVLFTQAAGQGLVAGLFIMSLIQVVVAHKKIYRLEEEMKKFSKEVDAPLGGKFNKMDYLDKNEVAQLILKQTHDLEKRIIRLESMSPLMK